MSIFGDAERLIDDLYPYRWLIAAAALLALAAIVAGAYRAGLHRVLWRHRLAAVIITALLLTAAIPAGYYSLSPLWTRAQLDEVSPLAAMPVPAPSTEGSAAEAVPPQATDGEARGQAAATDATAGDATATQAAAPAPAPSGAQAAPMSAAAAAAMTMASFTPRVARRGQFMGADSFHFGRGDALLIESAPGRYILRFENFSVRNGPDLFVYLSPSAAGYAEGALNLGRLRATDGAFNYEVPEGVDLARFRSVVVWCRRFAVLFATAPLALE